MLVMTLVSLGLSLLTKVRVNRSQVSPQRARRFKKLVEPVDSFAMAIRARDALKAVGVRGRVRSYMTSVLTGSLAVSKRWGVISLMLPAGYKTIERKQPERFEFLICHEAAHLRQGDSMWMELAVRSEKASWAQDKLLRTIVIMVALSVCLVWPCAIVWAFRSKHVVDAIKYSDYRSENLYRAEFLADLFATFWVLRRCGVYSPNFLSDGVSNDVDEEDTWEPDYHPDWESRQKFIRISLALAQGADVHDYLEAISFMVGPPERRWWHWVVGLFTIPCGCIGAEGLVLGIALREVYSIPFALLTFIPLLWFSRDIGGLIVRRKLILKFGRSNAAFKSCPELTDSERTSRKSMWGISIVCTLALIGYFTGFVVALRTLSPSRSLTAEELRGLSVQVHRVERRSEAILKRQYWSSLQVVNNGPLEITAVQIRVVLRKEGDSRMIAKTSPISLTELSNASIPYEGAILPKDSSRTLEVEFSFDKASLPARATFSAQLESAETPDLPMMDSWSHVYSKLLSLDDWDQTAFITERHEVFTLRSPEGLTMCMAVFASCGPRTAAIVARRPEASQDRDEAGNSVIHMAAVNPMAGVIDIASDLVGIDAQNRAGATALAVAVEHGHFRNMTWLLEHGADPNLEAKSGTTPLMIAARRFDLASCESLAYYGADPARQDHEGKDMLAYAKAGFPDQSVTLLRAAVEKGREERSQAWQRLVNNPFWVFQ